MIVDNLANAKQARPTVHRLRRACREPSATRSPRCCRARPTRRRRSTRRPRSRPDAGRRLSGDAGHRRRRPARRRRPTAPPRSAPATPHGRAGCVRQLTGWAFVGPATSSCVGPVDLPGGLGVPDLACRSWNGISPADVVGWSNYELMADDPDLLRAVRHTVVLHRAVRAGVDPARACCIAVALNRHDPLHRLLPHLHLRAVRRLRRGDRHPRQLPVQPAVRRWSTTCCGCSDLPQQGWLEDPAQAMVVIALMSLWGQAASPT